MDIRVDGKVAIVTGGSKGIGRAIAAEMVASGATVVVSSRNAEQLEATADEIGADWIPANAGDPAQAEAVVRATIERHGAADILVNNAATNPYAGPVIETDLPRWEKTLQVNLTAPLVWTQRCWEHWMHRHGGSVVNISSVGALTTSPLIGSYDITKSALLHLTRQLAAELAPRARVNAICPGLVKTDFSRVLWEGDRGDAVARRLPLERLGDSGDIATVAVFLASDAAAWLTGEHVVVDGGMLVAFGDL